MKYLILLLLSIVIIQPIFGQYKLSIIQEGNTSQLRNTPWVFGVNTYSSPSKRINDSTIEYTVENITEPTYLCVIIDTVKHGDTNLMWNWLARLWITPEIKHRELIINYFSKTVKVKDIVEWKQTTELDGKSKITLNPLPKWDSIAQLTGGLDNTGQDSAEDAITIPYIEKHPDSYLSLWFFTHSHALYIENADKRLALFNQLSPALQKYPDYHEAKASFKSHNYPNPGDAFKEFTLTDVKGKVFHSTTIKNKWILLHFWSNGCGPCVHEMDSIVSYYKTLDTSKIAFISLALDNSRSSWQKATTTHKIIWTNLWEPDGAFGDLSLHYNIPAMPFFVLFNSEKKLVIMQDGADALDTTIKSYLRSVK